MSWILAVWLRNKLIQLDMFWKTIFQTFQLHVSEQSNCMCSNIPTTCVRTFKLHVFDRSNCMHVFEHSNCMCSTLTCHKHFEQSLAMRSKFNVLITIDLDCCLSFECFAFRNSIWRDLKISKVTFHRKE